MNIKTIWMLANPKGHLLTAISYLIPIVCGAGFIIAIGMGLGGTVKDLLVPGQFDLWQAFSTLGLRHLGYYPLLLPSEFLDQSQVNLVLLQVLSSASLPMP